MRDIVINVAVCNLFADLAITLGKMSFATNKLLQTKVSGSAFDDSVTEFCLRRQCKCTSNSDTFPKRCFTLRVSYTATNQHNKQKHNRKTDGSASSTCWYAVLLAQAQKQNWQQQAKANQFAFGGWIVYLLGINYDTITLLPNSNSYFMGCFSEEIIIYEDVYGGRFIERYNKFTL